ncbi:unnamed protein product [Dovyalis caffra]|uniref:Bifunctional inhibitor/plant lipid transfer protein/seed storage helical domain-containing protein n=1 Tax=Dovyalis caffra TaxID=77055 RepID=A0AAV1QMQ1_9ROSI|nr:unnamed protein product [Dovyalis caffra]
MPHFVGCCLLLVLLVSGLDIAYSDSKCELVFEYFPYCLDFLTGYYFKPSKKCCVHIYKLNRLAKRGLGAQLICSCIEYMVRGTEPRIRADRISELPAKCQTHLSFPISEWMDCDKFVMGPPLICHCIEAVARMLPTRIRPDRIEDLSVQWDTHFAFSISEYMDCNSLAEY